MNFHKQESLINSVAMSEEQDNTAGTMDELEASSEQSIVSSLTYCNGVD